MIRVYLNSRWHLTQSSQLEAGVVDGASGKYGAVAVTRSIKNPVRAAFHLLAHGPHTLLVGSAADEIALQSGLDTVANDYFTTPERRRHLDECDRGDGGELGTVGAIVLDHKGSLAAAGSTGGTAGKSRGRVGDTAIIGAGLFADSDIAAVWCDQFIQRTTIRGIGRLTSQ